MSYHTIALDREIYTNDTTLGRMFIDGEFIGYTLEDTVRPYGVKVAGHTAIPEGNYDIAVTKSNRFKRDMPIIYTVADNHTIRRSGVSFSGIRIHGGNTHVDTHGCILVAKRRSIIDESIQGSLEALITEHIKRWDSRGDRCSLTIRNGAYDDTP